METALITSYAGLESIIPYLLEKEAGWSKQLLSDRFPFKDKLRAAGSFIRMEAPNLGLLPALEKLAKSENFDGYGVLAALRNRAVHPKPTDMKQKAAQGVERFEVLQLSQWLLEVFLLYLIDHDGDMANRTRYQRCRGETETVPFDYR